MTRSFAYAAALVTLGVVGLLTETFGAYRSAEIAHERTARSLAFASELRARSDRELNAALYLASGLVGYLVVRQSDAHAWAEVWLPERGWVRVNGAVAVAVVLMRAACAA